MLNRTSSQMCGRWYLPMFLFRDGLFALMYKASFMVLKRLWSSLPKMVKLSIVTLWPEMLTWSCMGMGLWDVPCTLLRNSLLTPQYTHPHNPPCHICTYIWPHFSWEVDLCPLGPLGSPWWYDHLWDAHQSHTFCKCSCNSHWVLDGRGPQCRALESWCYWNLFYSDVYLFFFLQMSLPAGKAGHFGWARTCQGQGGPLVGPGGCCCIGGADRKAQPVHY